MTDAEFAARVIAMQDTLYRVSTTILPRLCDREDAVQSAIEKALRRRGRLRDAAALEKWLTRILINECYTIHRRRRRGVLCGDPAARETARLMRTRTSTGSLPRCRRHTACPWCCTTSRGMR